MELERRHPDKWILDILWIKYIKTILNCHIYRKKGKNNSVLSIKKLISLFPILFVFIIDF
jgi:hypothetical protein